jgi:peptidoglycan/xylan/chitin deacetylase (PgdA/CDA1 family)
VRRGWALAGSGLIVIAVGIAIIARYGGTSPGGGQPDRGARTAGRAGRRQREASAANPRPQPGWKSYTGPVPILEYHVLGDPTPGAPYPELFVPRSDFRHEMDWLASHGYEAVTLDEVERAWYHGGTLPAKPVVLSFDDGYRPQFTFALPVLRKHGWPGVLDLKARGSDLYPSNVKAMLRAGWELASHTIHHLDLTTLDAAALKLELAGSRALLRREYGVPVDNFCYPAGRFNGAVIAAVKAAGYVGATTEIPGYASRNRPDALDRFEVLGSTGVSGLAADLSAR